jgi:hypothetical protein
LRVFENRLLRNKLFPKKIKIKIFILGGGVQLGPLGTPATSRPIVPAPGDYDGRNGGMMIGEGNRNTRRKPPPLPLCPPQTSQALPGREPGPPRWVKELIEQGRNYVIRNFINSTPHHILLR